MILVRLYLPLGAPNDDTQNHIHTYILTVKIFISTEFYTTFDVMLAESIRVSDPVDHSSHQTPDSMGNASFRRNSLPDSLGSPLMELLCDLLILPGGPRIRDRLSHGEIAFRSKKSNTESVEGGGPSSKLVSKISDCLLLIFDALISHEYNSAVCQSSFKGGNVNLKPREFLSRYKSRFHPIAQLRGTIGRCAMFLLPGASTVISASSSSSTTILYSSSSATSSPRASFQWSKFNEIQSLISHLEANIEEKKRLDRREEEGRELTSLLTSFATALEDEDEEQQQKRRYSQNREEKQNLDVVSLECYLAQSREMILSVCSIDHQPRTLFWDLDTTQSEETRFKPTSKTHSDAVKNNRKSITFHNWKATKRKKASTFGDRDVASSRGDGDDENASLHHLVTFELIAVSRQCVEKIEEALLVLSDAWDSYQEAWSQRYGLWNVF